MARGVSKQAAEAVEKARGRVSRAFGLKPQRSETCKLHRSAVIEKVRDLLGCTLNLPLKAMALCVAEQSQIQFLKFLRTIDERVPASLDVHSI